jgi:methylmalonyl-CoA mutase N-terminal domain/subunit
VEALTNEMERQCYEYFDRIQALGGVIPAIEANFFQDEIARASYTYQQQVEAGQKTVIGVNKHVIEEEIDIPILTIDPQGEARQRRQLAELRRTRDADRHAAALARVRATAQGSENLMPALIEAAAAYATLGEITEVLRGVFGIQRFSTIV